MAYTTAEQFAEQVKLALQSATPAPFPGIAAANVFRARQDAFQREEGDAINVRCDDEVLQPFSDDIDDAEVTIAVEVYVYGDVWETRADSYVPDIVKRIRAWNYAGAGLSLARVRRVAGDWQADQGDATPGKRTLKFAFRHFIFADDPTKQP